VQIGEPWISSAPKRHGGVPVDLGNGPGEQRKKSHAGNRLPSPVPSPSWPCVSPAAHVGHVAHVSRRRSAYRGGMGSARCGFRGELVRRRERVAADTTMIASSSTGGTVERGSFGPGREAAVEVRRFHFATVFRLIPYRLESVPGSLN